MVLPTITAAEVKRLIETRHVVAAYPRKGILVVDGFKRYLAGKWAIEEAMGVSALKNNPAGVMLREIKRMGGIKLHNSKDITGEKRAGKGIAGIPPGLFTRGGRGLDDLAIMLADAGYMIDLNDVDGGVGQLREMIRDEIDGNAVYYPGDPAETFEQQYGEYYGHGEPLPPRRRTRKARPAASPVSPVRSRAKHHSLDRVSQITRRPPTKRLIVRRLKNNQPGYFPNPKQAVLRSHVAALLAIYLRSGKQAAQKRYQEIVHAEQLKVWEARALAQKFQDALPLSVIGQIKKLQAIQKTHKPTDAAWITASELLQPLFKHMAALADNKTVKHRKNPVPPSKRVQIRNASKLYSDFTGHEASDYETLDKPILPDVMLKVGEIDFVGYTTVRDSKTEKYIHKFSKKCRPLFTVSHDGKQLFMLGGSYDFTERGIVDKT
jgi:hypothetical protein